jgi:hypothetical protein
MTSPSSSRSSVSDICAHVKHLGYAISRCIRLYGEEFEVVSDPFPEAGGIAVRVTTKKDSRIRVLRIPAIVADCARLSTRGTHPLQSFGGAALPCDLSKQEVTRTMHRATELQELGRVSVLSPFFLVPEISRHI